MNTAISLTDDLVALQDVMFAIQATREQSSDAPAPAPVLSPKQRMYLRADSRARAWIPAHLIDSLG